MVTFPSWIALLTILVGASNCLRFSQHLHATSVPESVAIGSKVVQIQAERGDQDPEGIIRYSIITRRGQRNDFHIDSQGIVTTRRMLDRESIHQYHLLVRAKLGNLTADTNVTVTVTDVNDSRPKITVNIFSQNGHSSIRENSDRGTFIAMIQVTDNDSGGNGEVSCMLDSQYFRLMNIYQNSYKITSAVHFDRERQTDYEITIRCSDRGQPRLTTSESLKVNVLDVNDNAPRFNQSNYHATLTEMNKVGDFVVQVQAADRDSGPNGMVRFNIGEQGSNQGFKIDAKTGIITAKLVFDYETAAEYQFRVIARDMGIPSRQASATVAVQITDVNQPPKFSRDKYQFSIYENQPSDSAIGIVVATDSDSPPYDQFHYSITSGNNAQAFNIDPKTGQITTRKMLDREQKDTHILEVSANDYNSIMLADTAKVYIHVADKNDNIPIIDFPNAADNTVNVARNLTKGSTIAKITAHDEDAGKNAHLTYHLRNNAGHPSHSVGPFSINCQTGNVYLNGSLSGLDKPSIFKLPVTVKDCGEPSHRAVTTLVIKLTSPGLDCGCDDV